MPEYALKLPDHWSESPDKPHRGKLLPQDSLEAARDEAQRLYELGAPSVYLYGRPNYSSWKKLRRLPHERPICDKCGTWVCHECWDWRRSRANRASIQICGRCGSSYGEFKSIRHRKDIHP